jgi:hypothetical protein
MAKGQKRSNREGRKPKRVSTATTAEPDFGIQTKAANANSRTKGRP